MQIQDVRVLRPNAVATRLGISLTTLWRLRRRGEFPQPVKISAGAVGWLAHELDIWIKQRAETRAAD